MKSRKDYSFVVIMIVLPLSLALVFIFFNNAVSVLIPPESHEFLENQNSTSTHQIQGQSMKEMSKSRDVFIGDWVPYQEQPLYNKSCSFITEELNCIKNGRPNTGYLYWSWKPRGCDLPRLVPARFLEAMRNKSWAFVGDSISLNHFNSLMCTLSTVEKAVPVYDDNAQTWHFPSYNFNASIIRSPLLAEAYIPEDIDSISYPGIQLHLDKLDNKWAQHCKNWDYMILSAGKWFSRNTIYLENNTILCGHFFPKRNTTTDLGIDYGHRRVLKNVFDHIIGSNHKGTVFYRTTAPDHVELGSGGGSCKREAPAGEGDLELKWLDKVLREVEMEEFERARVGASENGLDLRLFDVSDMLLLRPDGHPNMYTFDGEKRSAKVGSDCLHWCLPGPIDTWDDLLMEIIINWD